MSRNSPATAWLHAQFFRARASVAVVFNNIGRQPWVVGDKVVPRDILRFTCAIDHRVIDGSILAGLKYFARMIETGVSNCRRSRRMFMTR